MTESSTIMDVLEQRFPEARKNTLRDMVTRKRVLLNGQPVRSLKQPIASDDRVEVQDRLATAARPETINDGITILYQDADIIVVDKPSGLLTSTDEIEKRPTLVALLDEHVSRHNQKSHVHLVHRLDRDASGILVFARSVPALQNLKAQFAAHTIDRHYTALVHGVPKKAAARLEHHLREDEFGMVHVMVDKRHGRRALLDYQLTGQRSGYARLRVALFTGRKHQIRVQMKAIGCPICCDPVYGPRRPKELNDPPGRLALHASFLALEHPRSGARVEFRSPAPVSFDAVVPAQIAPVPVSAAPAAGK